MPILKGKRASKLKPEFVIFDPTTKPDANANVKQNPLGSSDDLSDDAGITAKCTKQRTTPRRSLGGNALYWGTVPNSSGTSSDSEYDDAISLPSPLMRRRCRKKRYKHGQDDEQQLVTDIRNLLHNNNNNPTNNNNNNSATNTANNFIKPESTYCDEMPEAEKLVLISSNIWGTKFKILGEWCANGLAIYVIASPRSV